MSWSKYIFNFFSVIYVLTFNLALARWATEEDLSVKYDYYHENITVNADGTFDSIVEYQATILKEQGRSKFVKLYFYYNEDSDNLAVLEAATINHNKIYNLDKSTIEDKPLASSSNGFDQKRQILLSFPNLEINSKIRLKLKYKNLKPVLEQVFSSRVLEVSDYIQSLKIQLNSKIPLNIKVNDPHKVLTVVTDQPENFSNLAISNIKPVHNLVLEEPENSLLNDQTGTWISVSSIKNWEELGLKFADGYYKVINQPLPKLFKDIRTAATLVRGDLNRINLVTSLLNEKIQYMGDWRSIKGKLFPRSLAMIADSQVGDCKDFSVSTAAILKQLGYKVQVGLVMRGSKNLSLLNLPGVNNFNHAMLKVTNKIGKVYWIDPTNDLSMAQGIFPDLSGKKVLILDLHNPTYEEISIISPESSKIINEENLEITDRVVTHIGNVEIKGEQALGFTGSQLYASKNEIENKLFYALAGSYIEEDPKKFILIPDLTSRIVKDIKFKYQYKKHNQLINTNLGFAIALPNPFIADTIISANLNQVSDLFIGTPVTKKRRIIINKTRINQVENLNYKIDTPWIYFNRECTNKNDNVEITDILIVKTNLIANQDIKSTLYQQLKNDLEQVVKNAILVISN